LFDRLLLMMMYTILYAQLFSCLLRSNNTYFWSESLQQSLPRKGS